MLYYTTVRVFDKYDSFCLGRLGNQVFWFLKRPRQFRLCHKYIVKMENLNDLTSEMAQKICSLAGKPFLRIEQQSEEKVIILISEKKEKTCITTEYIEIYENGMVTFTEDWGDEEAGVGMADLYSINALPITDYLREMGYEFVY